MAFFLLCLAAKSAAVAEFISCDKPAWTFDPSLRLCAKSPEPESRQGPFEERLQHNLPGKGLGFGVEPLGIESIFHYYCTMFTAVIITTIIISLLSLLPFITITML